MKQKFTTILLCVAASAAIGIHGQDLNEAFLSSGRVEVKSGVRSIRSAAADNSRYTLSLELKCNAEDCAPFYNGPFRVYNAERYLMGNGSYDAEKKAYVCDIAAPAGLYDIMFVFNNSNPDYVDGTDHLIFLVKENVEVNGDMTVSMNAADATNHIQFDPVLSNGEKITEHTYQYLSESKPEKTASGNVNKMRIANSIYHPDYHQVDYISTGSNYRLDPSDISPLKTDGAAQWDYYINDVSDKYEFRQLRFMETSDGKYEVIAMTSIGANGKNKVVSNNAKDFFTVDFNLGETPYDAECTLSSSTAPYSIYVGAPGYGGEVPYIMSGFASKENSLFKLNVCSGFSRDGMPLIVANWRTDFKLDGSVVTNIGPYTYLSTPEDSKYALYPMENYGRGENGNQFGHFYAGHPGIGFSLDQTGTKFLEAAPFMLLSYQEQVMNGKELQRFGAMSYGQMGERRGIDMTRVEMSLLYNGEDALEGKDPTYDWPYSWAQKDHDPGTYQFSVKNNNVNVGGLKGLSLAEMYFDTKNEDHYPPAFQMIQTRNTNGNFAIEFANPEEGEIRIVGGDFNNIKTEPDEWGNMVWFDYTPATLTVEYAPYGTEEYSSLSSIEKLEETYWGFNDYFKVALKGVNKKSDNKWYDLRLTFTDEAGNYSRHTLSPAFRIEEVGESGIDAATDDAVEVCRYSIDGKILSKPVKGINIVRLSNGKTIKEIVK